MAAKLTELQSQMMRNLGQGWPAWMRLRAERCNNARLNGAVTRNMRVLRRLGFVDDDECLTPAGVAWLASPDSMSSCGCLRLSLIRSAM